MRAVLQRLRPWTVISVLLWGLLLAGAAPAHAQVDRSESIYSGTADVALSAPNGAVEDEFSSSGDVVLECTASECTVTGVPPNITALQSVAFGESVPVPMAGDSGAVDLPDAGGSCAEIPPATLNLEISGDQLTLTYEDPPLELRTGDCIILHRGVVATFVGTRVDSPDGQESPPGSSNEPSGSSDSTGAPIGFVAGGAAVLGAAGMGVGLVVMRRRGTSAGAGGSSPIGPALPEIRAAHDPGRQVVEQNGPAVAVGVRATRDPRPRITIEMSAGGAGARAD